MRLYDQENIDAHKGGAVCEAELVKLAPGNLPLAGAGPYEVLALGRRMLLEVRLHVQYRFGGASAGHLTEHICHS